MDNALPPALTPAMTPEEWEDARTLSVAGVFDYYGLHAAAAIALEGQDYGFTREDVDALRAYEMDDRLRSIAARITSLLPPE